MMSKFTTTIFALLLHVGNTAVLATPGSLPDCADASANLPVSERYYPWTKKAWPRRDVIGESMATLRGGQQSGEPYQQQQSADDPYEYQRPQYNNYPPSGAGTANSGSPQDYDNGFGNANANYNPSDDFGRQREADGMFQESVQDRHDKWRSAQMEKYSNLTPEQEFNPRDEQGRMKLLSSVSKGSRALIFFVLMWRDIYLFEVTDQSIKGSLRKMFTRAVLTTVFLGNLAGVVTSVTSQGHSAKNRLKAILNLDKLVETTLLLWNLGRVTLFPSRYVEREIFVAGILHSVFFLIQCQAFTRVTWDEKVAPGLNQQQQQQNSQQQQNNQQQGYSNQPSGNY